jgi:sulfur carrier protein
MTKIKIFLNGDLIEINKDLNISQLLTDLDLPAHKIAIEKDLEIIHPQDFHKIILEENCRIEIVHFIGGG